MNDQLHIFIKHPMRRYWDIGCVSFHALKFASEMSGLCCIAGKMKLTPLTLHIKKEIILSKWISNSKSKFLTVSINKLYRINIFPLRKKKKYFRVLVLVQKGGRTDFKMFAGYYIVQRQQYACGPIEWDKKLKDEAPTENCYTMIWLIIVILCHSLIMSQYANDIANIFSLEKCMWRFYLLFNLFNKY